MHPPALCRYGLPKTDRTFFLRAVILGSREFAVRTQCAFGTMFPQQAVILARLMASGALCLLNHLLRENI